MQYTKTVRNKKLKTVIFKVISAIVIFAFLANTIVWANPDLLEASHTTLSAYSKVGNKDFKERFKIQSSLLMHEGVNAFIEKQIKLEKKILGKRWGQERTCEVNMHDRNIHGNIIRNIEGLDSVVFVKVTGLLAHTGQFAHVGLRGKNSGGIPTIYIDSSYYYKAKQALMKHELDEVILWEDLRVNLLQIDRDEMRTWIKTHITTPDIKLKGTIYQGLNSKKIAREIHNSSFDVEEIYKFVDNEAGFDYAYINKLITLYGVDEYSVDVNIAAGNKKKYDSKVTSDKKVDKPKKTKIKRILWNLSFRWNSFIGNAAVQGTLIGLAVGIFGMGMVILLLALVTTPDTDIDTVAPIRDDEINRPRYETIEATNWTPHREHIDPQTQGVEPITEEGISEKDPSVKEKDPVNIDPEPPVEKRDYASIIEDINNGDMDTCLKAIAELGELGGKEAFEALVELSYYEDKDIQREAKKALINISHKQGDMLFSAMKEKLDWDKSNDGLTSMNPKTFDFDYPLDAQKISELMKNLEGFDLQQMIPIIRAAGDKDPEVSAAALETLRGVFPSDLALYNILTQLVETPGDDYVRLCAIQFISDSAEAGVLRYYDMRAADAFLSIFQDTAMNVDLRCAAVEALGKIGYSFTTKGDVLETISLLSEYMKDQDIGANAKEGTIDLSILALYDWKMMSLEKEEKELTPSDKLEGIKSVAEYLKLYEREDRLNPFLRRLGFQGKTLDTMLETIKKYDPQAEPQHRKDIEDIMKHLIERAKTEGSPAAFLKTLERNQSLLEKALSDTGFTVKEIKKYRIGPNKAEFSDTTVYKEVEVLKSLGIIEKVEAYNPKANAAYRLSNYFRGKELGRIKTIIDGIISIEYAIGKTNEPLWRYDIPEKTDRRFVKELVKNVVSIENAANLWEEMFPAKLNTGKYYVIRYDRDRLRSYAMQSGIDKNLSPEKLLTYYADLLNINAQDKARVKVKPISSKEGKGLISVSCYKNSDLSPSSLVGESHIDMEGSLEGQTINILGMLNITLAASNIPSKTLTPDDRSEYERIILFVQEQYKLMTGERLSVETLLSPTRQLILPRAMPINIEKLNDYYRLAIRQLMQSA